MAFKILKQLIPAPTGADPSWAQRSVWVEKLTPSDTAFSFETEAEAITKKDELAAADSTTRIYKVVES